MTASILVHPTLRNVATLALDVLAECGPLTEVRLAELLGISVEATRSVLAALWLADRIEPTTTDEGADSWFAPSTGSTA